MSEKNIKQQLEVLLFMAREPLKIDYFAKIFKEEEAFLMPIMDELIAKYSSEDYGIQIF